MAFQNKQGAGKRKGLYRRLAIVLIVAALPALVLLEPGTARSHGGEDHDSAVDSSLSVVSDSTAADVSVAELNGLLDLTYIVIGSTYETVQPILKKSCYDCHSDQTVFPWYYKIPTVDAMIDSDIKEARKHLDMSNGFPFGGHTSQLEQLRTIREEVEDNGMPLLSYRFIHWGTTIDGARQDSLFAWIDSSIVQIEQIYNSLGLPVPLGDDEDD